MSSELVFCCDQTVCCNSYRVKTVDVTKPWSVYVPKNWHQYDGNKVMICSECNVNFTFLKQIREPVPTIKEFLLEEFWN